jgi:hypothetical protein
MKPTRQIWLLAAMLGLAGIVAHAATEQWEKPAADLAGQIAGILGPGQAKLIIRNLSSIPTGEIPAIRKLLAQDLKSHGITLAGAESANTVRVTLSEDLFDGLWIAEVDEGNQTQVVMVRAGLAHKLSSDPSANQPITLRKQFVWSELHILPLPPFPQFVNTPILAIVDTVSRLVIATNDGFETNVMSSGTWAFEKRLPLPERSSLPRDARVLLVPDADKDGFTAFSPGVICMGRYTLPADPAAKPRDGWSLQCHPSDDPWPIAQLDAATQLKAFYNASRNYFTGVVSPGIGVGCAGSARFRRKRAAHRRHRRQGATGRE